MQDTGEKILELLSAAVPKMSESEKERFLLFSEGVAAAVCSVLSERAQDSA